jgi:hypothetical protein
MWPVLGTISFSICFVYTRSCLVIAEVIAFFGVACVSMHERTLVRVGTHARLFVVLFAVNVRVVVEGAVAFSDGTTSALIFKMPIETCVRSVLGAFVLKK